MPSNKKKWKKGFDKRNKDIDDFRGMQTKCILKLELHRIGERSIIEQILGSRPFRSFKIVQV